MSEELNEDHKQRAEFLSKNGAPIEWVILTAGEVQILKATITEQAATIERLTREIDLVKTYLSDPAGRPFYDGDTLLEWVQNMHREMQQERKDAEAEADSLRQQLAATSAELAALKQQKP